MLARIIFLIVAFLGCGLSWDAASADKRVALVIGNSYYKAVPKLANPENDATAVGLLLTVAGFDSVEVRQNLSNADMRRTMRDFSESTKDADIAVVFFAGHGIEVGGTNYLIPVDSALKRDIDVEDEAVSLDRVLTLLEPAKRLRLVILDACRDNPFGPTMTRTLASRSIGRGLGKIEAPGSDTLVAYAAKAGSVAADGQGTNSPFTLALLKHLATPGLDIRLALGRVRDEVLTITNKRQEPFVYGTLGGATIALAALSSEQRDLQLPPNAVTDADVQASRDYEFASKVGTKEAWVLFLKKHHNGFYADLARQQQARLDSAPATPSGRQGADVPQKAIVSKPAVRVQEKKQVDREMVRRCVSATRARAVRLGLEGTPTPCCDYRPLPLVCEDRIRRGAVF